MSTTPKSQEVLLKVRKSTVCDDALGQLAAPSGLATPACLSPQGMCPQPAGALLSPLFWERPGGVFRLEVCRDGYATPGLLSQS